MWRNTVPSDITCTALMDHKSKGFKAVLVGMRSGEIYVSVINRVKECSIAINRFN